MEMTYTGGPDIAPAVAVRMERQTILYDQAKRFEFIITEGALLHPFVLFDMEGESLVTAETYSTELQIRDPSDVARYRQVVERLRPAAVPDATEPLRALATSWQGPELDHPQ
jgi:hypothetical protein